MLKNVKALVPFLFIQCTNINNALPMNLSKNQMKYHFEIYMFVSMHINYPFLVFIFLWVKDEHGGLGLLPVK